MDRTAKIVPALVLPLCLLAPRPQEVGPAPAEDRLPPGLAARIDDATISIEEYKEFLLRVYGAGPLQELVLTRLIEREATRLGITVAEEELDAELDGFWQNYLKRFRGDAEALRRELSAAGFTEETYLAKMRAETRRNLLEARIVLGSREISPAMLEERFERVYGKDGVRVELRHVLFTRARTKALLRQRGVPEPELTVARIEAEVEALAQAALERLAAGADFEALAREQSHDVSVHQNGGRIPGYNYERYGPEMAAAVRAAEVGRTSGPVQTAVGLHVIEVTSRTTHTLDEVRAELEAQLAAEPVTWRERNELRRRLRAAAEIQTFR